MSITKTCEITQAKAIEVAVRFLDRRGYDIIEQGESVDQFDIVAKDADTLVFVNVYHREQGEGFLDGEAEREVVEQAAIEWFAKDHDGIYVDLAVRFDVVALVVLASDRALIRHHKNAVPGE